MKTGDHHAADITFLVTFVVESPDIRTGIDELIVVEVGQGALLDGQRGGEHTEGVLQRCHPPAEHILQHLTLTDPRERQGGVYVADENIGLVGLAVPATGSHDTTVFLYQLLYLSAADE